MIMEIKITSCGTIKQKTRRDTGSPLIKKLVYDYSVPNYL